jgi:formylglycine-generating enzyme required for sulfatase activity
MKERACSTPRFKSMRGRGAPPSIMACNSTTDPSFARQPINCVNYEQAVAFCKHDGKRLPTEAEWEYAARAGSTGLFPDPPLLSQSAWYDPAGSPVTQGETHAVGRKQPNAWGLYDIRGNVAEWVQDWYSESYYKLSPEVDPQGPQSGRYHLVRGGSYHGTASYQRVSDRYQCAFASRRDVGFRVVRQD